MSRRNTYDDDIGLGGGFVAAFALIMVLTLGAFFLETAGIFDPTPLARAVVPPRADLVVLSNGDMAQPYRRSEDHLAAKGRSTKPVSLIFE